MKNKTTHTPGPWCAEPNTNEKYAPWDVKAVKSKTQKEFICQTSGNCKANAYLIASAPELLAALKYLVKESNLNGMLSSEPSMVRALEAIAKAEGGEP